MSEEEEEEAEANYFALQLLVPDSLLREEIKKLGGEIDLFGKDLKKLARRFAVSPEVMAIRLGEELCSGSVSRLLRSRTSRILRRNSGVS